MSDHPIDRRDKPWSKRNEAWYRNGIDDPDVVLLGAHGEVRMH